jgi:Ca-activated chloride channel homolog
MIRRDVFRIVGALLGSSAAIAWDRQRQSGKPDQEGNYTIRTTSRLVLLDVSVKDRKGGYVSGLGEQDFRVYENGKLQEISQFANADVPVTVGLVVDESGSMRPKRQEVIAASLEFISASNPHDEIFVVNFNERARRGLPDLIPFSDNIGLLRSALWEGEPQGRTALYDAIEMSLRQLRLGRRDKKTLVVISDGGDNHSVHTLPEVMQDVLMSVTTIYAIGIFDEDDPESNPRVLEHLAKISGGLAFFPKSLDQVTPICRQIAKDIRTRYTIGYVPSSEGNPERRVKVVAQAAGHDKLVVRTRTNYLFTPESPQVSSR